VDHDYLRYRTRSTAYLGDGLLAAGMPLVQPFGGHAIHIDARALLPHVPSLETPARRLPSSSTRQAVSAVARSAR
jgi:tryptophanase